MEKIDWNDYLEDLLLIYEWRDIEDYEGLYMVSEWGDVISLHGGEKKLLKQRETKDGYLTVNLCKYGDHKTFRVHRLVATAFCEGADYFEVVNHMDENPANNHYSNLEWCTVGYNNRYGTARERQKRTVKEGKPIIEDVNNTKLRNFKNAANILLEKQGYFTQDQLRKQYNKKDHNIKKKDSIELADLYISRVVKELECIKVRVNNEIKEQYGLPAKIKSNSFIYVKK